MSPDYEDVLDVQLGVSYRVEFKTARDQVVDYAVILIIEDDGMERTVRIYDGAHGVNELHRYNRRGEKGPPEVFHADTLGEGMRYAIEQIKDGFEGMVESWSRT